MKKLMMLCLLFCLGCPEENEKPKKTMDTCVSDCPTLCKVAMDNPSNGMQCMWTCINQCQEPEDE